MSQHPHTGEEASSAPVCETPSTWLGEPTVTFFHQIEYGRMPGGSTYLELTVDVASLMRDVPVPINRMHRDGVAEAHRHRHGVAEAHRQLREWLGIPAAKASISKFTVADKAPATPGKRPIPSRPFPSAAVVTSTPRSFQWVAGHLFGAHKALPAFIDQIVASRPELQAARLHEQMARRVSTSRGAATGATPPPPTPRRRIGI